jgi:Flp pilus assembly protein TadG
MKGFWEKRRFASQRGSTLVEFAMLVPVLMLLTFGTFEFGRVLNAQLTINNAAREGARAASVGATVGEIEDAVEALATTLHIEDLSIIVEQTGTDKGSPIRVTVSYPVELVTPFLADFFGSNTVTLEAEATTRSE